MNRDEMAALVETAGIVGGMAEPGETPQMDAAWDSCRIAYTPDCILLRAPFPSEGHDTPRVVMKPGDDEGNRRKAEAFLTRTATLQRRERAVQGHGTEHSPYPAWAFCVDGVVAAVAAREGFDLATSTRPSAWRRTVEPHHGRIASREAAWNWSRERNHVKGASDMGVGGGRITYPEMKGERLAMSLYNPLLNGIYLREKGGVACLHVSNDLPASMLPQLRGRKVSDVVDLDCDHVVTSAAALEGADSGTIVLKVRGPLVAVAPAPDGVDMSWLGLGARSE